MRARVLIVSMVAIVVGCEGTISGEDDAGRDGGADASVGDASDSGSIDASTAPDAPSDAGTDAGPIGSAGCGLAATAGVTTETIRVGTLDRTYVLSIPEGYDPNRAYPLLLAWHGRTGSGTNFRNRDGGGGVEEAADGGGIFVYPDGLPVTSDATDTGWQDTDFGSRDYLLFDALVEEMSETLCVDPDRIFSYGHSFGAYMTQGLACRRPGVMRGIAGVAGGPPYRSGMPCPMGGETAVWMHNAVMDETVDFEERGIPARDYWVGANHCDSTTTPLDTADFCVAYDGCDAPLHWCAPPTGFGHSFPSYSWDAIWAFFTALPER